MGPAALGRENATSGVVEALQCRQNADTPIPQVVVVTNDKRRQLDQTITVMLTLLLSSTHIHQHLNAIMWSMMSFPECSAYCSRSQLCSNTLDGWGNSGWLVCGKYQSIDCVHPSKGRGSLSGAETGKTRSGHLWERHPGPVSSVWSFLDRPQK